MEITINLPDWIKLPDCPKCSKELLTTQYNIMEAYLSILEERATIEGVEFIKLIKQETLK